MITNVNIGICHRRAQTGEPCFFVNWKDNGENNYKFFFDSDPNVNNLKTIY